jgi:plasmid maintenance system antidote protein VapI
LIIIKQKDETFEPDYVVAPGTMIADEMEYAGITNKQLALKVGLTDKQVHDLLAGILPLTTTLAERIGQFVSIPTNILIRTEQQYRARIAESDDEI